MAVGVGEPFTPLHAVAGYNGQAPPPRGRSMFGRQADSRKHTAPVYSFGTISDREQASAVFLSTAHVNVDKKCREGANTYYDVPASMDRQVEGRKASAPQYTFTHEERLRARTADTPGPGQYPTESAIGQQQLSPKRNPTNCRFGVTSREQGSRVFLTSGHLRERKGTEGAAPGSYDTPTGLGHQVSSQKCSGPSYSLPRTDRLKDHYAELSKTLPAVGQYDTWASIGKQTLSGCKTLPAYGFGRSSWAIEEKRFITSSHSNTLKGRQSPANFDHQLAENTSAFGKQQLSGRLSRPSHAFGSSPRLVSKPSEVPGPGAYE